MRRPKYIAVNSRTLGLKITFIVGLMLGGLISMLIFERPSKYYCSEYASYFPLTKNHGITTDRTLCKAFGQKIIDGTCTCLRR